MSKKALGRKLCCVLMFFLFSCSETNQFSEAKFDSAHSIALDGVISQGSLISSSRVAADIKNEIYNQLKYAVGQLNGRNAGASMHHLQIEIGRIHPRSDDLFEVSYTARQLVSWPREDAIPQYLDLIVPARADSDGATNFYNAFGSDEKITKKCLTFYASSIHPLNFWYSYRPEQTSCALSQPNFAASKPEMVRRFSMKLARSAENTAGKYPEYDKVWEDGRLAVTLIFSKASSKGTDLSDEGIASFHRMYYQLIDSFGAPLSSNVSTDGWLDVSIDDLRLVFNTPSGPLDIHLYLTADLKGADAAFQAKYNDRTRYSDFIGYSGHSGQGSNIKALANMGVFEPGQYQIFLVDGCDTLTYLDATLNAAHQKVNPNAGPHKYVDIINNAMPSYFTSNNQATMAMIKALVRKKQTYRQILSKFDPSQRAAIMGEEDNRWPLPFNEG